MSNKLVVGNEIVSNAFKIFRFRDVIEDFGGEQIEVGPTLYFPEIWTSQYTSAIIPGFNPTKNRRKAKRALNKYRKQRNSVRKRYNVILPFQYQ